MHDKYESKIQEAFVKESVVKGLLSEDYDFSGVKTVKISTLQTVPLTDYKREGQNRYGEPTEMQDTVQELTLSQDKGFSVTIDKGNNEDQNGIKNAGKALSLQIKEQCVPAMDKYVLDKLAKNAGTICASSAAITEKNAVERIAAGTVCLDDAEVPSTDRALLIAASVYKSLRLSDQFLGVDRLGDRALSKGEVGEFDGMRVVKVPKGRLPKGLNFMIVYKRSACAPVKLDDAKIHKDPPGLSGNLLEGRQYYDCFVFGAKCMGVYVDIDAAEAAVTASPELKITDGKLTATPAAGAKTYYTDDGTDPRYSASAKEYLAAVDVAEDAEIRAYSVIDGQYPSSVAAL